MDFNPFAPEFRANPYPTFRKLRDEAPVYATDFGVVLITRYEDVVDVLKRPELFSSTAMGMQMQMRGRPTRTVINTDPPVHTRLRGIVNRAFTPRMVAELEPRIREVARGLIDDAVARGRVDFVDAFAVPLPVTIIAEILGVDPKDRDDFKRWSSAVVTETRTAEEEAQQEPAMNEFFEYFEYAIAERRKRPREDLLSVLVAASEGDDPLTPDEVLAFTALLLIAGNETTTNLLGHLLNELIEHPAQRQRLLDEPALIPNAVEESLRYESPVQFIPRRVTEDAVVSGTPIAAETLVAPFFASANRDERRFPEPDTFDIRRNTQGHVAFGHGVHFCLGAPLARLEARVAVEELMPHLAAIELAAEPTRLEQSFLLRGYKTLPIAMRGA